MGNVISRCAQNVRNALRSCSSKKHTEEEAMLSTCDSEPLDKCQEPLFDPSVSGVDRVSSASRTESQSSLVRLQEKMETVNCKLLSSTPKTGIKFGTQSYHANHNNQKYQILSDNDEVVNSGGDQSLRPRSFIDQESQTNFETTDFTVSSSSAAAPKPCILSKEYIVKTYSIQNATPSPSPATQAKFPPANHSVPTPQMPPVSLEEQGSASSNSPIVNLERRQDDVLKRLENLQTSVAKLAQKYSISSTPSPASAATPARAGLSAASSRSTQSQGSQKSAVGSSNNLLDLVISVDPSSIPLSLVVLCESLSDQYRVLKSTFVHSSVSGDVPDRLQGLLTSNGGIKRSDCQIAISLVWKKVSNGPTLVVDPTRQTTIQGEANIARYFTRLLNPSLDESDIITATQVDELLDLAQLQLSEGNSKEKAAAVRTLNSALGKRDWLVGAEPSVADIVCWSVLNQTNQTSNPPANVKKWLTLCNKHNIFRTAAGLLN